MNTQQGSLKAVVFDVDGTLINSVDVHAQAWVDAFAEFGHKVRFGDVRRQIGKGGDQLMPVFLSKAEIERFGEELEERRGALLKERYLHRIKPFPAVRELFQRVIADGKAIALASSAKEDELEHYKKIANIVDLIDVETSSDDAEKSKPHPDIFCAALARLDITQPEQVLVIGDTPYDAEAAAKAGLRTVGLLCGGWSENELKRAGCVTVFRDPADLLARYAESPLASRSETKVRLSSNEFQQWRPVVVELESQGNADDVPASRHCAVQASALGGDEAKQCRPEWSKGKGRRGNRDASTTFRQGRDGAES